MKFKEKQFRELDGKSEISNRLFSLIKSKGTYGTYHKTIVHFHTPASHDYKVIVDGESKTMNQVGTNELKKIAENNNLYDFADIDDKYIDDKVSRRVFSSYKEGIAYLLIAQCLFVNQIELAVIADHNTINGYEKLNSAVNIIKKNHKDHVIPFIQLGIEISCGDKLHVVGILDSNEETQNQLNKFLNDIFMSTRAGTWLSSWQVIQKLKYLGGIAYVAHINTENILKDNNNFSGAYKKKLFSKENMSIVGISNLDTKDYILNRLIKDKKINDVVILYDEDSHNLNDLGKKFFWIKGQKANFNLFINAVHDSDISIRFKKPELPDVYIKNVSIDGKGFLSKSNDEPLNLNLSTSLNCIIGGRGTGKSTLIDCINFVLSQNVRDTAQLKNICNQGTIWLTVNLSGKDYFVKFNPLIDKIDKKLFLQGYLYGEEHQFQYGPNNKKFNKTEVKERTLKKIQIFKVEGNIIFEISEKKKFFKHIFKESYSINELVRNASDYEIQNFIRGQLKFSNNPIPSLKNIEINNDKELQKHYSQLDNKMLNHKNKVLKSIDLINDESSNTKIVYRQLPFSNFIFNWESILKNTFHLLESHILSKYNIKLNEIRAFLYEGSKRYNVIDFYLMFKNNEYDKLALILNEFISNNYGTKDINNGKKKIDDENIILILKQINSIIMSAAKIDIYDCINSYHSMADNLDLEFDINSQEDANNNGKIFKSISQISLGQKVVALLDFIFMFKDLTKDATPLLLDQPEDNLDSSYIYKHLVKSLRKQKDKRQVIIVTHNSTIVTNSKPEQIITMQSDNLHGWVKNSGYPTEKDIILDIINLLEGGINSFKHKQFIYKSVLKDN